MTIQSHFWDHICHDHKYNHVIMSCYSRNTQSSDNTLQLEITSPRNPYMIRASKLKLRERDNHRDICCRVIHGTNTDITTKYSLRSHFFLQNPYIIRPARSSPRICSFHNRAIAYSCRPMWRHNWFLSLASAVRMDTSRWRSWRLSSSVVVSNGFCVIV